MESTIVVLKETRNNDFNVVENLKTNSRKDVKERERWTDREKDKEKLGVGETDKLRKKEDLLS